MPSADFDELLGRIRGLVISLGEALSLEESAEVEEFLDHAELGEGLRTLAWLIVEEEKRVPRADIAEIKSLAARMDIASELPDSLEQQGADDA